MDGTGPGDDGANPRNGMLTWLLHARPFWSAPVNAKTCVWGISRSLKLICVLMLPEAAMDELVKNVDSVSLFPSTENPVNVVGTPASSVSVSVMGHERPFAFGVC